MVIRNLNIIGSLGLPGEADTVLIIDPDAVLADAARSSAFTPAAVLTDHEEQLEVCLVDLHSCGGAEWAFCVVS